METNKLDQFFREKLAENCTTPNTNAWGELESMLEKKKKKAAFWYYKIAASVVLILASGFLTYWILFTNEPIEPRMADQKQQPIIIQQENDLQYANPQQETNLELTPTKDPEKGDTKPKVVIEEVQPIIDKPNEHKPQRQKPEGDLLAEIDILPEEVLEEDGAEETKDENIDTQAKKKPAVTIVYKSSTKKENKYRVVIMAKLDTAKRRRPDIKEILRFPGQLLADVRSAKDDVFNPKNESSQSGSQDFE